MRTAAEGVRCGADVVTSLGETGNGTSILAARCCYQPPFLLLLLCLLLLPRFQSVVEDDLRSTLTALPSFLFLFCIRVRPPLPPLRDLRAVRAATPSLNLLTIVTTTCAAVWASAFISEHCFFRTQAISPMSRASPRFCCDGPRVFSFCDTGNNVSEAGAGGNFEGGGSLVLHCSATSLLSTVLSSFRCCFRRELFSFLLFVCIDTPVELWPELNCVLCRCLHAQVGS